MPAQQCPAPCCRISPAVVLETAPKERYSQAHRALEILRAPQKHGYPNLAHAVLAVVTNFQAQHHWLQAVRENPGNHYTSHDGRFADDSRLQFAIDDQGSAADGLRGYKAWTPSEARAIDAELGRRVPGSSAAQASAAYYA